MVKFQVDFSKKWPQQRRRGSVAVGLGKKGGGRKKGLGFCTVQAYHHRFVLITAGWLHQPAVMGLITAGWWLELAVMAGDTFIAGL
jgi:hypothetical protein